LQVEGINEPLPGLLYGDRTFSFLEMATNPESILEIVGKLSHSSHETLILMLKTDLETHFAICVHEPIAEPANSAVLSTRFLTSWGFRF
jgi:hypothetical protein